MHSDPSRDIFQIQCIAGRAVIPAVCLAAFGLLCAALASIGAATLIAGYRHTGELIAMVMVGGLAMPFIAFGVGFIGVALYMVANSLDTTIDARGIRTVRRIFGMVTSRRHSPLEHVSALESRIPARHQNPFGGVPAYTLVARLADDRGTITLVEDIPGEDAMQTLRARILPLLPEISPTEPGPTEEEGDSRGNDR